MPPFLSTNMIIDETKHDDKDFLLTQVKVLQENLLQCHNKLQIAYGIIDNLKKMTNELLVELSIHGVEYPDNENTKFPKND
jgi:hypothetical protein